MTIRTKAIKYAAGAAFGSVMVLAPLGIHAAGAADNDPAHHTTDVNDPDPAHHRPYEVCSASTSDCVLVPVAGFDVNGYPLSTPRPTPQVDSDPAHHSLDVNDPDPAHHRPILVDGVVTALPGFDLNGYPTGGNVFN